MAKVQFQFSRDLAISLTVDENHIMNEEIRFIEGYRDGKPDQKYYVNKDNIRYCAVLGDDDKKLKAVQSL